MVERAHNSHFEWVYFSFYLQYSIRFLILQIYLFFHINLLSSHLILVFNTFNYFNFLKTKKPVTLFRDRLIQRLVWSYLKQRHTWHVLTRPRHVWWCIFMLYILLILRTVSSCDDKSFSSIKVLIFLIIYYKNSFVNIKFHNFVKS